MPWGIYESVEVERDPGLDQFRESVARVAEGGNPVGYLATSVGTSWGLVGWHWWRPRWGEPREAVDCLLTLLNGPDSPKVVHDVLDADMPSDVFLYKERTLDLTWLEGTERDEAWARYGWDRDDVLTPPAE